jgi:hypothetical protein
MPAIAGNRSRLITGVFPLSAQTMSVDVGSAIATIDRTPLTATATTFIPGRRSSTMTAQTMVEDGDYFTHVTDAYVGTKFPVSVAVGGYANGEPVWLASAAQMSWSPSASADGGVDAAITYNIDGEADHGQVMLGEQTITSTTTGAAVDGGAASSNGGIAQLHVIAADGTTPTCTVTIEHSVNGSTSWATLATFTQVTTTPAAERVVVSSGTTVRRYLRAVATVAGTDPEYTLVVAFARR